jgi:NAD(P)H-flavin reductase/hemoglobin-like flavoprotein
VDVAALKASWTQVSALGDQAAAYFYATLFSLDPRLRGLFATSMGGQRDRLLAALGHIVSHVDETDRLVPFVEQLGRDHRRFEVRAQDYPTVGQALLFTLAYGLGPDWTEQLAADWTEAYTVVSGVMMEAAGAAERKSTPPWWDAEVIAHERRSADIAVLTVRPTQELRYRAGQSLAVESHLRPKVWRYLSPANAPRSDGTIEFHVRAVPGGQLSPAMVYQCRTGDVLRLGAPIGSRLTLSPGSGPDLLLLAGGTGVAPLRALVEELAGGLHERKVMLVLGAATRWELYDQAAITQLAEDLRWLQVMGVVSDDPTVERNSTVVEAALQSGPWYDRLVYVCGSPAMVAGTCQSMLEAGYSAANIRVEQFDDKTYAPLREDLSPEAAVAEVTRQ